jgi:queuine tRNA-ribosyltransferase
MSLTFEILHRSKRSKARVGRLTTAHGVVDTPGFVAVGTQGTLKAIDNAATQDCGLQLMFCNTYHLLLQPGPEVIKKAGGLHRFIHRRGPIITDSGGFQVFSLAYGSVAKELKSQGTKRSEGSVLKISEEGVLFRSYRDGAKVLLTPESSIAAQKDLGADIIIPFDELPPYHIDKAELKTSLDRTHRWEKRSLEAHLASVQHQSIYAVIHGGVDQELRRHSCETLTSLPFDGFAIGGSLGKTRQELFELLRFTLPLLPNERPNHLLGIGDLESVQEAIPLGVDTFDSSYPTKAARHGVLLTRHGHVRIEKREHASQFTSPEEGCSCFTCTRFSMAYLHHLVKAKELTALSLATIHNLHFMVNLMERKRQAILNDEL